MHSFFNRDNVVICLEKSIYASVFTDPGKLYVVGRIEIGNDAHKNAAVSAFIIVGDYLFIQLHPVIKTCYKRRLIHAR